MGFIRATLRLSFEVEMVADENHQRQEKNTNLTPIQVSLQTIDLLKKHSTNLQFLPLLIRNTEINVILDILHEKWDRSMTTNIIISGPNGCGKTTTLHTIQKKLGSSNASLISLQPQNFRIVNFTDSITNKSSQDKSRPKLLLIDNGDVLSPSQLNQIFQVANKNNNSTVVAIDSDFYEIYSSSNKNLDQITAKILLKPLSESELLEYLTLWKNELGLSFITEQNLYWIVDVGISLGYNHPHDFLGILISYAYSPTNANQSDRILCVNSDLLAKKHEYDWLQSLLSIEDLSKEARLLLSEILIWFQSNPNQCYISENAIREMITSSNLKTTIESITWRQVIEELVQTIIILPSMLIPNNFYCIIDLSLIQDMLRILD